MIKAACTVIFGLCAAMALGACAGEDGEDPTAEGAEDSPVAEAEQAASSCDTGPMECCNSVERSSSPEAAKMLGSLGIKVGAETLVGLGCSPVSALGLSGNTCAQQPVCCQDNVFNGLVVVGCSPINASL
jgi:Fungal hydrophobin